MPVFAAIPAVLGSIGAAAGVTGAGVAAATSIAAGAAIVGGVGAGIAGAVSASAQARALKKANAVDATPDASQTVNGGGANTTSAAGNLGRAALISTSPSGVQGIDATGRRKLIGND